MANRPNNVTAAVKLYSADQGGRSGPTTADFFGCVLQIDDVNLSARLWLDASGPLHPGQEARVNIGFADPAFAEMHCSVGRPFSLWDGRVIGEGTIETMVFDHRASRIARTA